MGSFLADVAQAFRVLRRDARFSIAALTTLALGIGATTAVFSTIYSVLFRPLPYAESGRLVRGSGGYPARRLTITDARAGRSSVRARARAGRRPRVSRVRGCR
jgi:hypothetical protein